MSLCAAGNHSVFKTEMNKRRENIEIVLLNFLVIDTD